MRRLATAVLAATTACASEAPSTSTFVDGESSPSLPLEETPSRPSPAPARPAPPPRASSSPCGAGLEACEGGPGGAAYCARTQSDNANCGACGNVCAPGKACTAGACACPAGTFACGAVCVDPRVRTLDQSQLQSTEGLGLSPTQIVGQQFTVGARGRLKGIEVQLDPCGASQTGRLKLDLFDAQKRLLGSATLDEAGLPSGCAGNPLSPTAIGPTYFDLASQCLDVQAGSQLTFVLGFEGGSHDGTCDQGTRMCSNNGRVCFEDRECVEYYFVGITRCSVGCDKSPLYPGGLAVHQVGTDLVTLPFQFAFKTFVE